MTGEKTEVKIEVNDKVCVEFAEGPFTGVVNSIEGGKADIGFDDGTSEKCALKDVKLISKVSALDTATDVTQPAKKSQAASPNAQQLADKANEMRKGKVDAANKAVAANEATTDAENAGKPLTAEEKEFMGKVEVRLNGKDYRSGDAQVKTARMTSLPSSADMTRYARLKRQKEG